MVSSSHWVAAVLQDGGYEEFIQEDFSVQVEDTREQALPSVKSYVRPKNLDAGAIDIDKANFDDPAVEPKGEGATRDHAADKRPA